jgi:hypothetical protein
MRFYRGIKALFFPIVQELFELLAENDGTILLENDDFFRTE